MPIEPGIKLGSYEVQAFIGQGAMGLVYRAYHPQLERFGAVKVLQGIASTPDAAARFRHEAQAIAQMRHPNIVNVYDFGEYEGLPYMIVEYVSGGNLASKMEQKPLDQAIALRYLRGIAAGLDYAHSLGIVHRDVKPGNVLLENDATPVLADFGLVKLLQGSSIQSMTGVTTGTPAYMAPEQVTGHQVGPAADRYSLATMAYEMLTGVIPFDGDGVLELLYAHVHREPPAPSTRNAALNPAVDAVILRGLAKAPEARWETATGFVDALAAALAGEPLPATTARLPVPVAATTQLIADANPTQHPTAGVVRPSSAATVAMVMPTTPSRKNSPSRRRLMEVMAGVVILLLLLLVGGVCAAASQKTTLALSPNITVPGGSITVTATHVPANQVGQIVLHSQPFAFPFQAGANGDVSEVVTVPLDAGLGDHTVDLWWGGSSHAQKILHVVAFGTLPSPTPSSSPSPSASGKPGTTPSPRRSPSPGASPTPRPTSSSSPKPKSSPSPSPRPTPRPSPTPTNSCPPPASGASLSGPSNVNSGAYFTVTGAHFTPGKLVTVNYYDPAGANTPTATRTTTVLCDGSFSVTFKAATLLLGLSARNDKVTAIDGAGRNSSYGFKLNPVL